MSAMPMSNFCKHKPHKQSAVGAAVTPVSAAVMYAFMYVVSLTVCAGQGVRQGTVA